MATYGVTYGSRKQPAGYGVQGSRSLASTFGTQSMQPLSSAKPQGFAPLAASTPQPLDALSRVLSSGQTTFDTIAPNKGYNLLNPPAPGAPPATGGGTPTPPAAPPAPAGFDETGDPILAQIKAAGQRGVQDAASGALAGAENDLVNYGSTQVPQSLRDLFAAQSPTSDALLGDLPANSILGALNDSNTGAAAAANPFSTVKQLGNAHDTNVHGIDQAANNANLYYSSTHANQLGDENQNYLGAQNTAAQNLASLLSGENNNVLSAEDTAHQQYLNELPNAYQRWIAAGDTGAPGTGGAGGTGGTPPPGGGSAPPTDAPNSLVSNLSNNSTAGSLYQLLQRYGLGGGGGSGGRPALAY